MRDRDGDLGAAVSRGADRRLEQRYGVTLEAELAHAGRVVCVEVGDVSGSGALVVMENPPPPGARVVLSFEDFGAIDMIVMHAGKHYCGLCRLDPSPADGLVDWAHRQPVTPPATPDASA